MIIIVTRKGLNTSSMCNSNSDIVTHVFFAFLHSDPASFRPLGSLDIGLCSSSDFLVFIFSFCLGKSTQISLGLLKLSGDFISSGLRLNEVFWGRSYWADCTSNDSLRELLQQITGYYDYFLVFIFYKTPLD